jgi:hypothetical protein
MSSARKLLKYSCICIEGELQYVLEVLLEIETFFFKIHDSRKKFAINSESLHSS